MINMPEEYTNRELGILIKNLCTKQEESYHNLANVINDGFKGTHARQDKTNGNVLSNTAFRLKVEGGMVMLKIILSLLGVATVINSIFAFINWRNVIS